MSVPSVIVFTWLKLESSHFEAFPYIGKIPKRAYRDINDRVLHAIAEQATGNHAYSPYDAEELLNIRDVLDSWKDSADKINPRARCLINRMNSMFARSQLYQSIQADQRRLHEDSPHLLHLILAGFLSVVTFRGSTSQSHRMEGVFADRCVNGPRWKEYLDSVSDDMTAFMLYQYQVSERTTLAVRVPPQCAHTSQSLPSSGL